MGGGTAVVLVLLVACRLGKCQRSEEVAPGLRNGLLFQPRGPLTLATGKWTAVIRFRQQDTERQANTLRNHFTQIDDVLQKMQWANGNDSDTAETRRGKQFLEEMRKMWKHEKIWMSAELEAAEAGIMELQAELKLSRQTRGLINAIGDGLKWLFGTATEDDTKALRKQIKNVEVGLGKLHHMTELQTTLIGTLTEEQKINTRNLAILAKKAAEMERAIIADREADHITMRNIRRELDLSQTITSAIRTAGAAVMAFHHEVRDIAKALEHTQQGWLTPAIMTPTRLKSTLNSISAHLPEGWIPAVPVTDAPAHIYHFLDLAALAIEDGWEVHIQIPLQYRPYSQYQLYQVTTIPTHLPNSSFALVTELSSEYFAISSDQRLHLQAKSSEISRCRQAGGRTMCHQLTPLIKEKREGCMYHAFRDDKEKANKACQKQVTKPKPQVYALTAEKWLYVLPKEETFSMQCAGELQPTKGFRLQGTGVFALPPGCAAMGDNYIVPAHLRKLTDHVDRLKLEDLTHFKISIDLVEFKDQFIRRDTLNQTELKEIMNQAAKGDASAQALAELQGLEKEWQAPTTAENDIPDVLVNHTSLTLGSISTLGVIIIVIVCCRQKQKASREDSRISEILSRQIPMIPTYPSLEQQSQILARLTQLEETTRNLQSKTEKIEQQEVALSNLERKTEELTALL